MQVITGIEGEIVVVGKAEIGRVNSVISQVVVEGVEIGLPGAIVAVLVSHSAANLNPLPPFSNRLGRHSSLLRESATKSSSAVLTTR